MSLTNGDLRNSPRVVDDTETVVIVHLTDVEEDKSEKRTEHRKRYAGACGESYATNSKLVCTHSDGPQRRELNSASPEQQASQIDPSLPTLECSKAGISMPSSQNVPTASNSLFEPVLLACGMNPPNPLTAALIVNCATVNLITQLSNILSAPIHNLGGTSAATQSTSVLASEVHGVQAHCLSAQLLSSSQINNSIPHPGINVATTPTCVCGSIEDSYDSHKTVMLPHSCKLLKKQNDVKLFMCPEPGCTTSFACRAELRDHWNAHLDCLNDSSCFDADKPESNLEVIEDKKTNSGSSKVPSNEQQTDIADEMKSQRSACRFYCTFRGCDKSYARCHRLNQHLARHTGTEPFNCDKPNFHVRYCSEAAFQRQKLSHQSMADKEVQCPPEGCDRMYENKINLNENICKHSFIDLELNCGSTSVHRHDLQGHENPRNIDVRNDARSISMCTTDSVSEFSANSKTKNSDECGQCENLTSAVYISNDLSSSNKYKRALPVIAPKTSTSDNPRPLSPILLPPAVRKTHKCPFDGCGKVFPKLCKLRDHVCLHTGQRPYACPRCKATFIRLYDLRRHTNVHFRSDYLKSQRPLAPKPLLG